MSVAIRASDPLLFAASSPMSSSSLVLARSSNSHSSQSQASSLPTPINTARTPKFSNAGIHQVPAPNLARPGATPPPPPPQLLLRRYQESEIPSSGFKPIIPTARPSRTSRRGNSRATGETLETDIITIDNIDKYKPKLTSSSKPGDSFLRSVSSTLQVKRTDENTNKRGKVFDEVIYEDHGDQFKPSESRSTVRFSSLPMQQVYHGRQLMPAAAPATRVLPQASNSYRIYTNTDDIAWRRVRS